MNDFIQKQIASSERLYKIMFEDHLSRVKNVTCAYEVSESLQKKLKERDEEIAKLRSQLRAYEIVEKM
jgi:hypothetical protein